HTIKKLNEQNNTYDYFMFLQPTSPLRDSVDIINAVNLLFRKDANSIISVCETEHSPLLMNTLDGTLSMECFLNKKSNKRRQELPKYYRINGAIYLSNVRFFQEHQNFYSEKSYAYIMEQ